MNKTRSYMFIAIAFVLSALAIGYYVISPERRHKAGGAPEKVTIAHSTLPYAALAQIAQVQGYYLQEGLHATPQLYPYGKLALEAVLNGSADFAAVAETPVMFAIVKGAKIAIIATIQTSNKSHAIVARKDRGIVTPDNLKGKKIAATFGTTGEFFMDVFLLVHGISRKDMKVFNLKPEEMRKALENGEIDAASTWDPFLVQAQKELGDRGTTFYDEQVYTQTFNVVATQEYIGRNPGRVIKMLRALIEAERFCWQQPAEAQQIVADFSHMDGAVLREIWPYSSFKVRLDQSLVLALEDETRWAMNSGLIEKKDIPNYLDFLHLDGLLSVKPGAVRILR